VPGISKAGGDNKVKARGELKIRRHRLVAGQLDLKTLGALPLNSSNLPTLGALPLTNNPLTLGALPLNSSNLLTLGALPLNSNNPLTLGKLLLLLQLPHLKIPGDNSKRLRPNSKPGVCRQVHRRQLHRANRHRLQVGVNLNKLIRGGIRQRRHQSHNLQASKLRALPAASQAGSKAILACLELVLREMRPTKLSYVRLGNRTGPWVMSRSRKGKNRAAFMKYARSR
jgi:hypothetical protein